MKKKLREEIAKILGWKLYDSYYFPAWEHVDGRKIGNGKQVNRRKLNNSHTKKVDFLLSLFDKTIRELVGKDFKTITGWSFDECGGCGECGQRIGYDLKRQEILDKLEKMKNG